MCAWRKRKLTPVVFSPASLLFGFTFAVVAPGRRVIAARRSLSATKQRRSSRWGSWRASAVYKTSKFAHDSDVWFNTPPKYFKTNKQCLTENQQTKRQRGSAFALDQKLKSEESVWMLIKHVIVEIALRKLSVFMLCRRYLPRSIFMMILVSLWSWFNNASQLHTVKCVGSVTVLFHPPQALTKKCFCGLWF